MARYPTPGDAQIAASASTHTPMPAPLGIEGSDDLRELLNGMFDRAEQFREMLDMMLIRSPRLAGCSAKYAEGHDDGWTDAIDAVIEEFDRLFPNTKG